MRNDGKITFYILRHKKRSKGDNGEWLDTLLDIPFIAATSEAGRTIIHGLGQSGKVSVQGLYRKNLDTITHTAKKYKVSHPKIEGHPSWSSLIRKVELVGGDIWQVPIKRGPHDKGPFLLEPALSSFNAYLSKHRELESKQGQTPDNAEIPSARIRQGLQEATILPEDNPQASSSGSSETDNVESEGDKPEQGEEETTSADGSPFQVDGASAENIGDMVSDPVTKEQLFVALHEELTKAINDLRELEEAGNALQAGVDEFEQVAAQYKERKEYHMKLKARCRELKAIRKQRQATERALKELLDGC